MREGFDHWPAALGVLEASFFKKRDGRGSGRDPSPLGDSSWYLNEWGLEDELERVRDLSRWIWMTGPAAIPHRRRDRRWAATGLDALWKVAPAQAHLVESLMQELEGYATHLLGLDSDDGQLLLYGVTPSDLREEGFAPFFVATLLRARLIYTLFREGGRPHNEAFLQTINRLDGIVRTQAGGEESRWIANSLRANVRNLRRYGMPSATVAKAAEEFLVRLSNAGIHRWPWLSELGDPLGHNEPGFLIAVTASLMYQMPRGAMSAFQQDADWPPRNLERVARILEQTVRREHADTHTRAIRDADRLVRATLRRFTRPRTLRQLRPRIQPWWPSSGGPLAEEQVRKLLVNAEERMPTFLDWLHEALMPLRPPRAGR